MSEDQKKQKSMIRNTVKFFIDTLGEDITNKLIMNTIHSRGVYSISDETIFGSGVKKVLIMMKHEEYGQPVHFLRVGFVWDSQEEGADFWYTIFKQLCNLECT